MQAKPRTLLHIAILLLACYFIFFFGIGARDLWNPDEPRYAQVAREMLESGDWIVPHLNGKVYTEKPPLYFWLVALASKPFGDVNETTARIPAAVAATLGVLLTYFFGRKLLGAQVGFLGALITATSAQFFSIGRDAALDQLLTLCIVAALATFYLAYVNRRSLLYVVGFVFLAPAALSKGPVGIAVPVVVMLAFLILEVILRKENSGKQVAWFLLGIVGGLVIVGLIVGPWWRAAFERSGGVYGSVSILLKQTKGRMLQSYSHQRPFHYYFGEIMWQFLPWTVFIPSTVIALKRHGKLRENTALRFLTVWFLSVFLFFTAVSGKRSQYILPLMPAGGLLLAWAFTSLNSHEGRLRERRIFLIPSILVIILAIIGLGVLAGGAYGFARDLFPATLAAALVGTAAVIIMFRMSLKRPPSTFIVGAIIATTLFVAAFYAYIGPVIDRYKSARPFCNTVKAAMEEGDELLLYRYYRPNVHYYMHRQIVEIKSKDEIMEALAKSKRLFLITQSKEEDALLSDIAALNPEQVARQEIGNRDVICYVVDNPGQLPDAAVSP